MPELSHNVADKRSDSLFGKVIRSDLGEISINFVGERGHRGDGDARKSSILGIACGIFSQRRQGSPEFTCTKCTISIASHFALSFSQHNIAQRALAVKGSLRAVEGAMTPVGTLLPLRNAAASAGWQAQADGSRL
ncbi:hypothetical protein ACFSQQ_20370 [Mesorhizobium kowhaii]|uniref:hypothetical protein n=1 Tax=Mesorhizobium kowhaii TaxID=1300272 RepID=UPI0035E81A78